MPSLMASRTALLLTHGACSDLKELFSGWTHSTWWIVGHGLLPCHHLLGQALFLQQRQLLQLVEAPRPCRCWWLSWMLRTRHRDCCTQHDIRRRAVTYGGVCVFLCVESLEGGGQQCTGGLSGARLKKAHFAMGFERSSLASKLSSAKVG